MRKTLKGQTGLSLVEVTIMLLVLMLLTSVLAPSFWDFVHDAQWVKVKEDCEAIGISFTRLTRDIGPCLRVNHTSNCDLAHRVDVLYSEGAAPKDATALAFSPNMLTDNWLTGAPNNRDSMDHQFVTNAPGYNTPYVNYSASPTGYPVGPLFGLGWRGAYLAPPIGPDPWGMAYYVNSGFNAVATNAVTPGEGQNGFWWERDVICLTAGPDQTIQTSYWTSASGSGTNRVGDDFVHVISGSGR